MPPIIKSCATILSIILVSLCVISNAGAEAKQNYTSTFERYELPDVVLINQDGVKVPLQNIFSPGTTVLVDFVYTTCTTICPVLSANFTNFQRKITPDSGRVRLVSISIDPEYDTPKAMKAYLKRYYAKPGWDFLTGSRQDIDKVLKALKAFTQNKMNHFPLILVKSPAENRWIRIYGLIGTAELMKEYEKARQ